MSLMSFEPFRSFRDLDRLSSQLLSGTRAPLAMPMDVWREGQTYHVAFDLPGVQPDKINLEAERNTLTVTAHREPMFRTDDEGDVQVQIAERPMGTFTRQLVLGEGLDTQAVQAEYTDGVLHVSIPVAQTAQPRRIEIAKTGGSSQPQVIESSSAQGQASSQQPS